MRLVMHCIKQSLTCLAMAVISLGFLCFVSFCHTTSLSLESWSLTQQSYHQSAAAQFKQKPSPWDAVPYNSTEGLVWFLHLTDLHISKFRSPDRTEDLRQFCRKLVRGSLRPRLVVVTGDLTDAKVRRSIPTKNPKIL